MGGEGWLEITDRLDGRESSFSVINLDEMEIRHNSPLAKVLEIGSKTQQESQSKRHEVLWEYSLRLSEPEIEEMKETGIFQNTRQDERSVIHEGAVSIRGVRFTLALLILK